VTVGRCSARAASQSPVDDVTTDRTGAIGAMMDVIEPLIPRLRRYARSLMNDTAAADDLVQDCLERAIRAWPQRRADGDARAWMFAILHNLAINRLRQTQRRGAHVDINDAPDMEMARAPSQEHAVRLAELMAALDTLPADQRSVLLLVSVEDLSYEEAARVLDVPIGTVMSRLSRGRQRLLQMMDPERVAVPKAPHLRRVK
jgi:RNA polymerase sigma factor (sigma-70 family)